MATRVRKGSARCPCFEDDKVFQKVVDLKEAGLVVYRHTSRTKFESKKNVLQQSTANNAEDTFVLHNTKDEDINSADIMIAFEKYGISCQRCRYIIENAKHLLRTVSKINKNNIMGICDHCRRKLANASCIKCDRIVKEFVSARTEAKDSVHNDKPWQSQIHRLVNEVVIDETKIPTKRSYSDINISSIHRDSLISIGGPEIRDVFYSETAMTDIARTPFLSNGSYHARLNVPKIKKRLTFINPTESYQTANKPFYSRSHEDLTHEIDDWPKIYHTAIPGTTKKRRNITDYDSMTPLPDHNESTKIKPDLDFQSKKPKIGNGESAKANFQTNQLRKSMTDFKEPSHIPSLRKYNSEEGLITAISDLVDDDTLKKGFQYYFPKEVETNLKKPLNLLSSSTLIKDTHEMLHARAEKEKMKREEDRLRREEEKELKRIARVEKKQQMERESFAQEAKIIADKITETEKQERQHADAEEKAKSQKEFLTELKRQEEQNKKKGDGLKESDELESMTKESKSVKNKNLNNDQPSQVIKDTNPEAKKKLSMKSKDETKNKKQQTRGKDLKESKELRTNKDSFPQGKNERDAKENIVKDSKKPKSDQKDAAERKSKGENVQDKNKKDRKEHDIKDSKKSKSDPKDAAELESKGKYVQDKTKKDRHEYDFEDSKKSKPDPKKSSERERKDEVAQSKNKGNEKDNTDIAKSYDTKQGPIQEKTKVQIHKPDRNILKEEKKVNQKDKSTNVSDGKEKDNQEIRKKQSKNDESTEKGKESHELGKSDNKAAAKKENKYQSTSNDNSKAEEEFKKLLAEQSKQKEEDQKQKKNLEEEERKAKEAASKKLTDIPDPKSTIVQAQKKLAPPPPPSTQAKPEKKQENPTKKDLSIQQIKVKNPSTDDLIIQLVKTKQSTPRNDIVKPFDEGKINRLIVKHKGHRNLKPTNGLVCTHSDLELELENFVLNNEISDKLANIVIGEKIYKYKSPITKKHKNEEMSPIFFKTAYDEDNVTETKEVKHVHLEKLDEKSPLLPPHKATKTAEPEVPRGVIRYALSDRTFIEKGWTLLPTEKVVRKMNVYRMRPAHPEFDWFEHNKSKQLMQYDSGEKLAEFDEKGRGRWFYKNGRVALDYYDAEETNTQQRFVVYSSGELDERGRSRPFTILATFDHIGNGIVFDHSGKIRLKYNQTEGVVLDRAIGPVSHWKWHTLNDPPVLQQVMIDTQMPHKDPDILKLGKPGDTKTRPDNEEMLAIEFDNFIKEKSKKLTQSFKPFQIKMKALKINEQFSLKVLDQATVYLIFRDGAANLKLNLGMILDHKEIVDTDTAEVGEVSNSLERLPARTDSIAGLQKGVARAQYVERLRVDRERRLRPTVPTTSVDRLNAAATRPLKPPFRTAASCTSASTVQQACKCRKPSSSNLYYDTRLI